MANETYERAAHNYGLDPVLTAAEIGNIDRKASDAISGAGGTYAPTEAVVLGGSGLDVEGPLVAVDAQITIPSGKTLTIADGGVATVNGEGGLVIAASSSMNVSGSASVAFQSSSELSLAANVDPIYTPARTVTRRGVRLVGVTYNGSVGTTITSGPTNDDAWISSVGGSGQGRTVVAKKLTTLANEHFVLEVPGVQEMNGAVLASVTIKTVGLDANTPTTYPTFEVFRRTDATIVSLRAAGAVNDGHFGGAVTWNATSASAVFTCDQNNTIDTSLYDYTVKCTHAAQSPSGTQFYVQEVVAVYTVSSLNR